MALIHRNRVQEVTTTTGTGTLTLGGAVTGYQSFAIIGNGNTAVYTITDGISWEVGIGTYTLAGTTLSRDTVLESFDGATTGTSKISWGAGTKYVFVTNPASVGMVDYVVTSANQSLPSAKALQAGSNTVVSASQVSLNANVTGLTSLGATTVSATSMMIGGTLTVFGSAVVSAISGDTLVYQQATVSGLVVNTTAAIDVAVVSSLAATTAKANQAFVSGLTATTANITNLNVTTVTAATLVFTTARGTNLNLTGALTADSIQVSSLVAITANISSANIATLNTTTATAATLVFTTARGGALFITGAVTANEVRASALVVTTANIATLNVGGKLTVSALIANGTAGISGQVLQTRGSAATPEWVTLSFSTSAGVVTVSGAANQLTVAVSGGEAKISIASPCSAPSNITATRFISTQASASFEGTGDVTLAGGTGVVVIAASAADIPSDVAIRAGAITSAASPSHVPAAAAGSVSIEGGRALVSARAGHVNIFGGNADGAHDGVGGNVNIHGGNGGGVANYGDVFIGSGLTDNTSSRTTDFLYIPVVNGAPGGTPNVSAVGWVPIAYDISNNRLYVYNGAWKLIAAV